MTVDFLEADKASKDYCMSRTMMRFEDDFKQNFVQREIEGAFLAGIKWVLEKQKSEEKHDIKWHDLYENPNDLPPIDNNCLNLVSITVMTESLESVFYDFDIRKWISVRSGTVLDRDPQKWTEPFNIMVGIM